MLSPFSFWRLYCSTSHSEFWRHYVPPTLKVSTCVYFLQTVSYKGCSHADHLDIGTEEDNILQLDRAAQVTICRLKTRHCQLLSHLHRLEISPSDECPCTEAELKQQGTNWSGMTRAAQKRVRWRGVVDGLCSTGSEEHK